MTTTIPRSAEDDYTEAAAEERLAFAREATGAALEHVGRYSCLLYTSPSPRDS